MLNKSIVGKIKIYLYLKKYCFCISLIIGMIFSRHLTNVIFTGLFTANISFVLNNRLDKFCHIFVTWFRFQIITLFTNVLFKCQVHWIHRCDIEKQRHIQCLMINKMLYFVLFYYFQYYCDFCSNQIGMISSQQNLFLMSD